MQPSHSNTSLFVVGCGAAKIWDRKPELGAVPARDAYTSSLFVTCRRYAETNSGGQWAILSAKHGFLRPSERISDYDKSFKDADAITVDELSAQWRERFPNISKVVCLAGAIYAGRIAAAIPPVVQLELPLRGMNLFKRTKWLASAVKSP